MRAPSDRAEESRDVIYLDFAATTPVDPEVLAAMMPCFTEVYGNASSTAHAFGWAAADMVEHARAEVAALVGAARDEVVFTSGATEANLMALMGAAVRAGRRRHLVSSPLEHKSVLACLDALAADGFEVSWVAPRDDGHTHVADVLRAVRPDTALVSLMWVNNELGVENPIPALAAALAREAPDVLLHSDATQAVGRVEVDLRVAPVHLLSLSAHKLYGPKGVGALIVRRGTEARLGAVTKGGGQERGLRGGTLNVPGIVGLGRACALARTRGSEDRTRMAALGRRLVEGLERAAPIEVNGRPDVPGIVSVAFPGVRAAALLKRLGGRVAMSTGSACAAGGAEVSHVLRGLGLSEERARATVRLCVGRTTTHDQIDRAIALLTTAARELGAPEEGPRAAMSARTTGHELVLTPIGHVRNGVTEPAYLEWQRMTSRVAIDEAWAAALDGLEHYSHVVVVFWMHHVGECKLTHVPQANFRDAPEVGIFACRCPYRPNPIAVTTVRLVAIDGLELVVAGLDAVDGTPVVDLKPYTPQLDVAAGDVRVPPWVDKLRY